MFRKLNLYLFAGFVFSLKIAVLIGLTFALGLAALMPFTGGEFIASALFMIAGISALFAFLNCLTAFFFINTMKLWGFKFPGESEGFWVLSLAALATNIWFMLNYDRNFLDIYVLNLVISVGIILLGNRFYQATMKKCNSLDV